jgi:hypothetical protein
MLQRCYRCDAFDIGEDFIRFFCHIFVTKFANTKFVINFVAEKNTDVGNKGKHPTPYTSTKEKDIPPIRVFSPLSSSGFTTAQQQNCPEQRGTHTEQ